jgi:hypothetical protein
MCEKTKFHIYNVNKVQLVGKPGNIYQFQLILFCIAVAKRVQA